MGWRGLRLNGDLQRACRSRVLCDTWSAGDRRLPGPLTKGAAREGDARVRDLVTCDWAADSDAGLTKRASCKLTAH
eukprot:IDg14415t1